MHLGHALDDATILAARAKGISVDDLLKYLSGSTTMHQTVPELGKTLNAVSFGKAPKAVGRFAGSALGRGVARTIPGLSAVGNVMDVADIISGPESGGNKAMDAAGMVVGGAAGAMVGGPLGASVGASLGKMASDGIQFVVGGGKSAEQRKMEEALALLRGGQI